MALVFSLTTFTVAHSEQSSWNKTRALKEAGYVELSPADAVQFLVGKSVLMKRSSRIDGEIISAPFREEIYYFPNDQVVYQCGVKKGTDCFVQAWRIEKNNVCFELISCEIPAKIMKSPQAAKAVRLGVYVRYDQYVSDIVEGDRTHAPFAPRIAAGPIELDRADFDQEIKRSSQFSGGDKEISIVGPRAIPLLIGNTFLSSNPAQTAQELAVNPCPAQGTYYSPEGRVIRFSCLGAPDHIWTISVSNWKIEAGQLCRDGPTPDEIGSFGCQPATVTAVFTPRNAAAGDKLLVHDKESGGVLTGYAGNVMNFEFKNKIEIPESSRLISRRNKTLSPQ